MEAKSWWAAAEGAQVSSIETHTCVLIPPRLCAYKISPTAKLVFGWLWLRAGGEPKTVPGGVNTATVGAALGIDRRTVDKTIVQLQKCGLVDRLDRSDGFIDVFVKDPSDLVRGTKDDHQRTFFDGQEEPALFAQTGPSGTAELARPAQDGPDVGPSCAKRANVEGPARYTAPPGAHAQHAHAYENSIHHEHGTGAGPVRVCDLVAAGSLPRLVDAMRSRVGTWKIDDPMLHDLAQGMIDGKVPVSELGKLIDDISRRLALPRDSKAHVRIPGAVLRVAVNKAWPGVLTPGGPQSLASALQVFKPR